MKYNIQRNNYNKNEKSSTIYTPDYLVKQIWKIIKQSEIDIYNLLDPSVGTGALIDGFESYTFGVDIEDHNLNLKHFIQKKFEETTETNFEGYHPDLVICNPPFNGHPSRKLYPEVFLRHIVELFGNVPIVMIAPPTLRLNQRKASKRWRFMRDNVKITSILTLPIDIYEDVLFHSEVLFFNIPNIEPHYFLEIE